MFAFMPTALNSVFCKFTTALFQYSQIFSAILSIIGALHFPELARSLGAYPRAN
jgi:hypothetical protein